MHQRDPRPVYSYDDQNMVFQGHVPQQTGEYVATGYHQYDGNTHYYAAPPNHPVAGMGGANECASFFHDLGLS